MGGEWAGVGGESPGGGGGGGEEGGGGQREQKERTAPTNSRDHPHGGARPRGRRGRGGRGGEGITNPSQ